MTDNIDENIGGNVYDKYGTKNPIARLMQRGFLAKVDDLLPPALDPSARIVEVGCGEGHLLHHISRHYENRVSCVGYDIDSVVIREAREAHPQLQFEAKGIEDLTFEDGPPTLLVCCEVLEHLPDPQSALKRLAAIPCDYYLFSAPLEPIWRVLNLLRFKYIARLGNTPGHIQHWSKQGFVELIEEHFVIERLASPFPWTMVRAKRKTA